MRETATSTGYKYGEAEKKITGQKCLTPGFDCINFETDQINKVLKILPAKAELQNKGI